MTSFELASALRNTMPPIGFCSRQKRLESFLTVAQAAEDMSEGDNDLALEAMLILMQSHKPFQKAAVMGSLMLDRIPVSQVPTCGRILCLGIKQDMAGRGL